MDRKILFLQDEKEKLVDHILSLEDEVERLRRENETLRHQIDQLKEKPSEKPPFKKEAHRGRKPPHLWGRKKGHPGSFRPTPDQMDRHIEQNLTKCPRCQKPLGKPKDFIEHIQEDIVPSRVEVTRFRRYRYWCLCCHDLVTAPYASDEVPYGHLGPRTLATMVWLKYVHALPGNKIRSLLKDFCGLRVSEGAIAQALQRLGHYLKAETDQILQALRQAPYKHGDETGWNVNGLTHWLWTLMNGQWAYFHIDRSRGSRLVKDLLGNPFEGILISDFYGAYNRIKGLKQKCLVHLRREMRDHRGNDPPASFLFPYRTLARLLSDALRLAKQRRQMSEIRYARRVRRVKERLFDFATATYSHKFWQRLSKRLLKHERELFTFLDIPGLPSHNNAAERAIRPHVIIRNRSYQSRTSKGALAHSRLTSLLQTLSLQHREVIPALSTAYLRHRQQFALSNLSAPYLFHSSPLNS